MNENAMPQVDAARPSTELATGTVGRLARLETVMEWVKRLLWFLIALVIGIYFDLPTVVQGLLPQ